MRLNSKPIQKEDVITSEHLIQLCNMLSGSSEVIVLRDLAMILLSYTGFLRFDEVSDLRFSGVEIKDSHAVILIRKSKTDIYRGGKHVYIARGVTSACPVAMLERYFLHASFSVDSDMYLFCPACRSGSKCFFAE